MRIFFQPIDHPRDAVFDRRHVKVDEQAKTLVREPKISQKLLLVNRGNLLHRFDFYDNLVFHDQIGPESGVDADILINS